MEEVLRDQIFKICDEESVWWTFTKWITVMEKKLNISLKDPMKKEIFRRILIERVMDFLSSDESGNESGNELSYESTRESTCESKSVTVKANTNAESNTKSNTEFNDEISQLTALTDVSELTDISLASWGKELQKEMDKDLKLFKVG